MKKREIGDFEAGSSVILLVEDDDGLRRQMQWALKPLDVITAGTRKEAIQQVHEQGAFKIALVDLGLPPDQDGASEGLALLNAILSISPNTKVIIVSGNCDRNVAVDAVRRGAFDFISKPIDLEVLKLVIERAYRMIDLECDNRALRSQSEVPGLIFSSSAMDEVARLVKRVSKTETSVMIVGESGTGKELVARALHITSDRAEKPLVTINCAAIPEMLLESELFGHERGAFTGAFKQTIGKFELANRGTLFLDEIGDMPLPLQAKLLRFLQCRQFERIGGRTTISVDVRVISATNQPLEVLVSDGRFREDLYYRLNEIRIALPPLRDREGDVILLAQHFRILCCRSVGRHLRGFTDGAVVALREHSWPGNVRELENRVKRAVIMGEGVLISEQDLDLFSEKISRNLNLRENIRKVESVLLNEALSVADGNISKVSKLMGISRPQVYTLINIHKVQS